LDPVLEALLSRLVELKSQYIEHLANGSLGDYAEYKYMCGVVEGLSMSEREIKELGSKIMKDDESF
jgi:hypothetical protein|tara:strand:- start:147 stop:344 length:198 start_codon:yes stop_codon:yes gene_type:complete